MSFGAEPEVAEPPLGLTPLFVSPLPICWRD
jgi:hypothetical protein